jgi:hypothetical protein
VHARTQKDRQTHRTFAYRTLRLLNHCIPLCLLPLISFCFLLPIPSYSIQSCDPLSSLRHCTAPYSSRPNPLPLSLPPSLSHNKQALRHRSVHIMHRLFPIVEYMVRKGGNGLPLDTYNKPCQDMVRTHFSNVLLFNTVLCFVVFFWQDDRSLVSIPVLPLFLFLLSVYYHYFLTFFTSLSFSSCSFVFLHSFFFLLSSFFFLLSSFFFLLSPFYFFFLLSSFFFLLSTSSFFFLLLSDPSHLR